MSSNLVYSGSNSYALIIISSKFPVARCSITEIDFIEVITSELKAINFFYGDGMHRSGLLDKKSGNKFAAFCIKNSIIEIVKNSAYIVCLGLYFYQVLKNDKLLLSD